MRKCVDKAAAAASCLESRAAIIQAEDPSLLLGAYGKPPLELARAVRGTC